MIKLIVAVLITVDIVVFHLKKSKVGNNNPALTILCSMESGPENSY